MTTRKYIVPVLSVTLQNQNMEDRHNTTTMSVVPVHTDGDDTSEKVRLRIQAQRQRLYPTLYTENSNVQQILDHFAVDYYVDARNGIRNERKRHNDRVGIEPASKKSKHPHPLSIAAGIVDKRVTNSNGHKEATTGTVGISKLNDVGKVTDAETTTTSKLNVAPTTNTSIVPEEASHQFKKDIMVPSLKTSTNDKSPKDEATQHGQRQQENQAILPVVQQLPAAITTSSSSVRDIWGQIPPKEYIPNATNNSNNNSNTIITNSGGEAVSTCMMICSICQQKVGSSLRYASHLDKCLGIGTMSRNTTSNASSISQSNNHTFS